VITYYWPPGSSPGVQRWLKLIKELCRRSYEVVVFTVEKPYVPAIDYSLEKDVPSEVTVIKTPSYEPTSMYNLLRGRSGRQSQVGLGDIKEKKGAVNLVAKYLRSNVFIPDAKIGWYLLTRKRLASLIKDYNIDIVVSTGPPHTAHLMAKQLQKATNVKWVADFRDPWVGVYYDQYLNRSKAAIRKNESLERQVVLSADQVITVSDGQKRELLKYRKDISVILNGYDVEDIPSVQARKTDKFILRYTGKAKEEEDFDFDFRLSLVGNISNEVLADLDYFGIQHLVEVSDFVPHHDAIRLMIDANLLWLPIPQSEDNENIITGKIFEYLASATPILSVGPTMGDASAILKSCDRDPMQEYQDEDSIEEVIRKYFNLWKKNSQMQFKHKGDLHKRYSRSDQAETLHKILSQL